MRLFKAKEALSRKISRLTSKLTIEPSKKLVVLYLEHCIVWLRDLNISKIRAKIFGKLQDAALEKNKKIKW